MLKTDDYIYITDTYRVYQLSYILAFSHASIGFLSCLMFGLIIIGSEIFNDWVGSH